MIDVRIFIVSAHSGGYVTQSRHALATPPTDRRQHQLHAGDGGGADTGRVSRQESRADAAATAEQPSGCVGAGRFSLTAV